MRRALLVALPLLLGAGRPPAGDLAPRTAETTRSRPFRLPLSDLAEERVRLPFFAGEEIDLVRDELVPLGPGGFLWTGHVSGAEWSSLVLSVWNETLSGSLRTPDGQYRIRSSAPGLHRIEEVHAASEPPERQPLSPTSLAAVTPVEDDGTRIDLLVVATARARRAAGGWDALTSLVLLGVGETNLALEKSGVSTRLRLVELRELPYREAGRVESDLEILKEERDGALDEAHALRDAYGADLVMLVVEEGDGCGVSYSMGNAGAAFADWAFSVVERSCIDSSYALAHELGHNLGCDHAPEDPTTRGAFAYSHGYKDLASGIRTIMAYGPGKRVPRFSNPRIPFFGIPVGTSQQDNARSLNELSATAARFRASRKAPLLVSSPGSRRGSIRFGLLDLGGPPVKEWRLVRGSFDSGVRGPDERIEMNEPGTAGEAIVLWYRRGSIWLFEELRRG